MNRIFGRRDLLKGAAMLPFALGAACESSTEQASSPFQHGVASGDPLPDAVILWTRVSGASVPVDVDWEIGEDPALATRIAAGTFRTDADRDFTVKVDARGLSPGKTYFYRFRSGGVRSEVGRTRTAPTGTLAHLRLAMVSCASYAHGYFHGYRELAKLEIDAVVHLGDYIYEYANGDYGDVRASEPAHEAVTLADYRMRHGHYKRDEDLKAVHLRHPFITVWDDHETANDSYKDGAQNHSEGAEGDWQTRKAAGKRAYFEWMPIREQEGGKIYRTLSFGDLVDLVMLDTRLEARTKQSGGFLGPMPAPDPTRTLLGDVQATWMEGQIRSSKARWKLVGQQIMIGNLFFDAGKQLLNLDQWHGYPESRNRFIRFLRSEKIQNVVILSGDIHSSWANEVVIDPNDAAEYDPITGRGSVAVEVVTPGITSPGIPDVFLGVVDTARPFNPHVKWVEPTKRGFIVLDIVPERVQAAWYHLASVDTATPVEAAFANAWSVRSGQTHLERDAAPA